jgi:hypothetical protein
LVAFLGIHEAHDGSTLKLTTGGLVDYIGQLLPSRSRRQLVTASLK